MKRMVLGTLLGVGLVTAAIAVAQQRGEVYAQHAAPASPGPGGGRLGVDCRADVRWERKARC